MSRLKWQLGLFKMEKCQILFLISFVEVHRPNQSLHFHSFTTAVLIITCLNHNNIPFTASQANFNGWMDEYEIIHLDLSYPQVLIDDRLLTFLHVIQKYELISHLIGIGHAKQVIISYRICWKQYILCIPIAVIGALEIIRFCSSLSMYILKGVLALRGWRWRAGSERHLFTQCK